MAGGFPSQPSPPPTPTVFLFLVDGTTSHPVVQAGNSDPFSASIPAAGRASSLSNTPSRPHFLTSGLDCSTSFPVGLPASRATFLAPLCARAPCAFFQHLHLPQCCQAVVPPLLKKNGINPPFSLLPFSVSPPCPTFPACLIPAVPFPALTLG